MVVKRRAVARPVPWREQTWLWSFDSPEVRTLAKIPWNSFLVRFLGVGKLELASPYLWELKGC